MILSSPRLFLLHLIVPYCSVISITWHLGVCETNFKLTQLKQKFTIFAQNNITGFHYYCNNTAICHIDSVRDLGVTFDAKLYFDEHIASLWSMTLRIVSLLMYKCEMFSKLDVFVCLCKAYVQSCLNYALIVWNWLSLTDSNRIKAVQKKATHLLHNLCLRCIPALEQYNYEQILKYLCLIPPSACRNVSDTTFIYKCVHSHADSSLLLCHLNFAIPRVTLQKQPTFYVPSVSKSVCVGGTKSTWPHVHHHIAST